MCENSSYALHGVGGIMIEAPGVEARGRITPQDLSMIREAHVPAYASLISSLKAMAVGLPVGIQLMQPVARLPRGVRTTVARGRPGSEGWLIPKKLSAQNVEEIQQACVTAAERAFEIGANVIKLHAADGYLLHYFLYPFSTERTDKCGGSV
ncbi:FMN-linked oxidoreductase [Tilletiaria anomala UBC 951]|uniref:FMN-linked oxidoreductase n=1 Tax=Tilletiaria anomala (strain ATCC 24038 / CBS 436.72 / UBC 951) TaxID=1037660 RepID=A0A066WLZ3_TILAU|nr:FMN-linked oxidoreductase [Tilletiaria anomala UBC 951]KDN52019.1 FMN-linked oxidoreductase [Tilletiaria anomala UBC 951]